MNWPEWAPRRLTNFYDTIGASVPEAVQEDGSIATDGRFLCEALEDIKVLCTDQRMESVFQAIDAKTTEPDYHWELSETITYARMAAFPFQALTSAQFLEKRKQAAAAARKLRNLLSEIGFDGMTVFPTLGAKAMSFPIDYFLPPDLAPLPATSTKWTIELKKLNQRMMVDHPGIGTWRYLLDRLATAMETDGKGWKDYKRISGHEDTGGRARNFALDVDEFIREWCGCQLVPQVLTITEIFFPDDRNREALEKALRRRAHEPRQSASIGAKPCGQ